MSERLHEYFVSEATEYLDQLEALLALPGRPDLDQLLRLAHGVRGSAQMAGAETLAMVAERLEDGVRSVQAHHVVWSDDIRQLSAQTVADLKILLRASNRWGALEEVRVRQAIDRWSEAEPSSDWRHGRSMGQAEMPIEQLFYDDAGPHVLTPDDHEMTETPPYPTPVPVETLLLDPADALTESLSLCRALVRRVTALPGADGDLVATVWELQELLEIAVTGGSRQG